MSFDRSSRRGQYLAVPCRPFNQKQHYRLVREMVLEDDEIPVFGDTA